MGSTGNSSSSEPLDANERTQLTWSGMDVASQYLPQYFNEDKTVNTDYLNYASPDYKGLSNGDYNALEDAIYNYQTAKLDTSWKKGLEDINQTASDRGLWSSGVPVKNAQEYYSDYIMPTYQQAASNAIQQRYNLESSDLQNENTFNQTNATNEYNSKARWLDYIQGLYNSTGGVISSSTSSGWSL